MLLGRGYPSAVLRTCVPNAHNYVNIALRSANVAKTIHATKNPPG
jgi:hypothetical protein